MESSRNPSHHLLDPSGVEGPPAAAFNAYALIRSMSRLALRKAVTTVVTQGPSFTCRVGPNNKECGRVMANNGSFDIL